MTPQARAAQARLIAAHSILLRGIFDYLDIGDGLSR